MKKIIIMLFALTAFISCTKSTEDKIAEKSYLANEFTVSVISETDESYLLNVSSEEFLGFILVIEKPSDSPEKAFASSLAVISTMDSDINANLNKSHYYQEGYPAVKNFSAKNEEQIKRYLSEKIDLAILRYQIAQLIQK